MSFNTYFLNIHNLLVKLKLILILIKLNDKIYILTVHFSFGTCSKCLCSYITATASRIYKFLYLVQII